MPNYDMMREEELQVLAAARETYGSRNQILVAIEELNELGAVLAKFGRYDSEAEALNKTRGWVIEEVADVLVVLDHVWAIYQLTHSEVSEVISDKIARVKRWIEKSDSFQHTTIDRQVGDAEPLSKPETPAEELKRRFPKRCCDCWFHIHPYEANPEWTECSDENVTGDICPHWMSEFEGLRVD